MSYVLDALRKAERERKLGRVPALSTEVQEQPSRRSIPWAWVASGALTVVVVVLLLVLWQRADSPAVAAAQQQGASAPPTRAAAVGPPTVTALPAARPEPATQPEPVTPPPPKAQVITVHTPNGPVTTRIPASSEPSVAAPAQPVAAAEPVAPAPVEPVAPQPVPERAPQASRDRELQRQIRTPVSPPEPVTVAEPQFTSEAGSDTYPTAEPAQNLPSYNGLSSSMRGSIGTLDMNVLIYSSTPGRGFVIINGKKYRAGDTLEEGPDVVEIRTDGVVLDYRGTEFMLPVPR